MGFTRSFSRLAAAARGRAICIGVAGALLGSVAPSPALLAFHRDGPVCRGACANTPQCCCKARRQARNHAHCRGKTELRAAMHCCPDNCTNDVPAAQTSESWTGTILTAPAPRRIGDLGMARMPSPLPRTAHEPAQPRAPPSCHPFFAS